MGAPMNAPAAGASGGRAPLQAVYRAPRFLNHEQGELHILFNNLRNPICTQVYMLVEAFSDFRDGEFTGSYAELMEFCTPPKPERGPRQKAPSMRTIRRAVKDLESSGLIRRSEKNMEHGQLRLWVSKAAEKPAPKPKQGRV